jgi:alpha-tubulin suppressor-like RCC1 family protein
MLQQESTGNAEECAMNSFAPTWRTATHTTLLTLIATITLLICAGSASAVHPHPQVAVGGGHACAAADDGSVRCWGANSSGQLGNGGTADSPVPVTVPSSLGAKNAGVKAPVFGAVGEIAASADATCAIDTNVIVWCWGANTYGQLGNGASDPDPHPVPQFVAGDAGLHVISAGRNHFCALSWQGDVSCWGSNAHGQVGSGTIGGSVFMPTKVAGLKKVKEIVAGGDFTCALLESRTVKCWGADERGQLGRGVPGEPTATAVDVPGVKDAYSLIAGDGFACALSWTENPLRCWGDNQFGQLAQGTLGETAPRAAVEVGTLGDVKLAGGTARSACALARTVTAANSRPLSSTHGLSCWGDNAQGQLGVGDSVANGSPRTVQLANVGELSRSAAGDRQCAIVRGGDAWCWGAGATSPAKLEGVVLITRPQSPEWAGVEPTTRVRRNRAGTAWRVRTKLTVMPSRFVFPADACKGRVVGSAYYYRRVRSGGAARAAGGVEYKKIGVRDTADLRRVGEYCGAQFSLTIPLARFGDKRRRMLLSARGLGNRTMAPFDAGEFPLKDVNKKISRQK